MCIQCRSTRFFNATRAVMVANTYLRANEESHDHLYAVPDENCYVVGGLLHFRMCPLSISLGSFLFQRAIEKDTHLARLAKKYAIFADDKICMTRPKCYEELYMTSCYLSFVNSANKMISQYRPDNFGGFLMKQLVGNHFPYDLTTLEIDCLGMLGWHLTPALFSVALEYYPFEVGYHMDAKCIDMHPTTV